MPAFSKTKILLKNNLMKNSLMKNSLMRNSHMKNSHFGWVGKGSSLQVCLFVCFEATELQKKGRVCLP
jgi:hypothetical protein